MSTSTAVQGPSSVPAQVFEAFLAALAEKGASAALVDRLRTVLIVERSLTERALRAAVLAPEPKA